MFKKDEVTNMLLYAMGADETSFCNKIKDNFLDVLKQDDDVQLMRKLCKVRSAIMLRDWNSCKNESYQLQEKICAEDIYREVVGYLRPKIGYVKDNDFTNQALYEVVSAAEYKIKRISEEIIQKYEPLKQHRVVLRRFISCKKQLKFPDFLSEMRLMTEAKVSIPWGVYTPMWYKLYTDNKQTYGIIMSSDTVFLPKLYFSCGKYYNKEGQSITISEEYTAEMKSLLETLDGSRNISVVIDGDNVKPLYMMVVMKFMSKLKNVKSIKVAYSEDTLIRWENIYIDKVYYYKSKRYYNEKNNTDLLVGALMVEQQYKGASTIILISSDGDYINIVDLLQESEVIVIQSNHTCGAYLSDLVSRGVQVVTLDKMFTEEQIINMASQDKRMQSVFALPVQ